MAWHPQYISDLHCAASLTQLDLSGQQVQIFWLFPKLDLSVLRCFSYCGPVVWNKHPTDLRSITTVSTCKNRLKPCYPHRLTVNNCVCVLTCILCLCVFNHLEPVQTYICFSDFISYVKNTDFTCNQKKKLPFSGCWKSRACWIARGLLTGVSVCSTGT